MAENGNGETAPLLGDRDSPAKEKGTESLFSPSTRILFAGFIISLSFSYTQTPLLYTFHIMVCEEFYRHAPPWDGPGDRCARNEIDAGAAAQVALMGSATIVCAITNLFVAGWQMRRFGPRAALAVQTFFPAVRVCIQGASLVVGARAGLIIMQLSQLVSISGGPAGYILVLNTIVAEITEPAARTAMFGRLQGVLMLGVALGYLVGGVVAEKFGIRTPFDLAAASFAVCFVYCVLFVPYVDPKTLSTGRKDAKAKGAAAWLGPLKVLGPQRLRLEDGRLANHHGIMFLALGIFTGVIATGFAQTLIQMYSMTVFGFGSTNNSLLMSVGSLIRGIFLMFIFPRIISTGRSWFASSTDTAVAANAATPESNPESDSDSAIPTEPLDFDPVPTTVPDQEPGKPPKPVEETAGAGFDLFFLRWSLLVDGVVTASSAFATQGWHMYLVAFLLPLASGSAPASKGVLTEMVPASRKADAIQAMTLVEYMASFSTLGIFGTIFSTLADAGKSYLTFYCNAAVAVVGVCILLLSRFPPQGSELVTEEPEEHSTVPDEARETTE